MAERGSVSQCIGKVRYATQPFAEKKAKEMSRKYSKNMREYYCGMCNGYHLTSKPRE